MEREQLINQDPVAGRRIGRWIIVSVIGAIVIARQIAFARNLRGFDPETRGEPVVRQ